MGQEEIQEKIKKIKEELQGCTLQELEQVQHTLDSLRTTCEGQLHYLGNFLGIEQQGEDLYKMRLGLYNANTYGNIRVESQFCQTGNGYRDTRDS